MKIPLCGTFRANPDNLVAPAVTQLTPCTGKPYEGNNGALSGIGGRRKIAAMSDTTTLLRQQLQQLEAELRAASLWSAQPPSE